jgi:hypothetical protein
MKLLRRKFLYLAASTAAAPGFPLIASALDYPTRPVHLLVGFAAGGIVDIKARLIGEWLSEYLGQPFIIEDRPGAGSNLATELVARALVNGDHDPHIRTWWSPAAASTLICLAFQANYVIRTTSPLALNKDRLFARDAEYISSKWPAST